MTQILNSQDNPEVPAEQIIDQQNMLIRALKQEILRLQQNARLLNQTIASKEKQWDQAQTQINSLKQKIDTLKENNESLLQTLQVFQREFVKRDYKSALALPIKAQKDSIDGSFFMELIRNLKTKISEPCGQPVKVPERSHLGECYGYFFHSDVEEAQLQLFNDCRSSNQVRLKKIRSYGKKNYFNEKFRHYFWSNISENCLSISEHLYQCLQDQLEASKEAQTRNTNIIDMDLRRMDLKLEEEKSEPMKIQIKKCLELFALYRPDINYVQGMSYLVWMLLIRMNSYQAFSCFSNMIICDPFMRSLYMFKEQNIKKIVKFYNECLEDKKPKLAKHMEKMEVEPEVFVIEWAYTFFSRAFSLRITSKIWDLWFSQGFNVFFKVTMAIMEVLEPEIMEQVENDRIIDLIRTRTHQLQELQFLRILQKQRLYEDLKL